MDVLTALCCNPGCGPNHDLVYFADLINKTGRDVLIENCNDFFMMGDTSKTQNCPANFFRTGGDIFGNWAAIIDRIQLVITKLGFFFQDPNQALSRPGCWVSRHQSERALPLPAHRLWLLLCSFVGVSGERRRQMLHAC